MNKETLIGYVEKFKDFKILVVGDVVLDHYVFGKVERLNPEAPVPILHAHKESEMTGGAGNVAKNVAGLGAKAILIGAIGNDGAATSIEAAAKQEGYDLHAVVDAGRSTIRKVRYLVGSQQLLRVDFEETHDVEGDVESQIIQKIQEAVSEVDAVLISDYAKGVITKNVAEAILKIAKENNLFVAADVKPSRAAYVVGATFISPNLKEGHEFLGLNPLEHTKKTPAEIARLLHEKMNTDVFLTLGPDGMYVVAADGSDAYIPRHVVEVADQSGAGDTAIVTMLLARLAGASALEAAHLANAGGSAVVRKIGNVAISPDELVEMLKDEHE